MAALYELSNGDLMEWPSHREIAERAQIPEDDVFAVGRYNEDEGYCQARTMGGLDGAVSITARGIRRAEQILDKRQQQEPLILYSDEELRRALEPLVAKLGHVVEEADLDAADRADVESDIQSATDQLKAARPNRGVIRAALERVRQNLVAATVLTAAVTQTVDIVMRRIGH
jgi:hypothetical protein